MFAFLRAIPFNQRKKNIENLAYALNFDFSAASKELNTTVIAITGPFEGDLENFKNISLDHQYDDELVTRGDDEKKKLKLPKNEIQNTFFQAYQAGFEEFYNLMRDRLSDYEVLLNASFKNNKLAYHHQVPTEAALVRMDDEIEVLMKLTNQITSHIKKISIHLNLEANINSERCSITESKKALKKSAEAILVTSQKAADILPDNSCRKFAGIMAIIGSIALVTISIVAMPASLGFSLLLLVPAFELAKGGFYLNFTDSTKAAKSKQIQTAVKKIVEPNTQAVMKFFPSRAPDSKSVQENNYKGKRPRSQ
ncbi:MAG: hypothetical protein H0W64_01225 [Gammaproteobacteria bacterium]|nr:hypothetical protein [Gammaproteobacteria bacterium]